MLLHIVTLGIYGLVWWYKTHDEMKRHSGQGLGGGIALLLAFFVAFAMLFVTPSEVAKLYINRGQQAPVSAVTGLWILLPIAGPIVWFVKVNGALNGYWRSQGLSDVQRLASLGVGRWPAPSLHVAIALAEHLTRAERRVRTIHRGRTGLLLSSSSR